MVTGAGPNVELLTICKTVSVLIVGAAAIFAANGFRLFGYKKDAELAKPDRFTDMKAQYEREGAERTNRRYGYVHKRA